MGERIGASIRFGGNITREQAERLVELVNEYGLSPDFDESGEIGVEDLGSILGDWQVNYGNLDGITSYCVAQGIAYHHWFDYGPEWAAGGERHLDGEVNPFIDGGNGAAAVTLAEIKRDGTEATIARLEWFEKELPQLIVVDTSPAAEGEGRA